MRSARASSWRHSDGGSWKIGISDPAQWHENAPLRSELELKSGVGTTSGSYERGAGHLIAPRTGQAAQGAICATVVAADAVTANARSTNHHSHLEGH